jgi:hypothetical protein
VIYSYIVRNKKGGDVDFRDMARDKRGGEVRYMARHKWGGNEIYLARDKSKEIRET